MTKGVVSLDVLSGVETLCSTTLGNTRDGLIRSIIQKYHPGLAYLTDVAVEKDDSAYYGEWDEHNNSLTFTTECDGLTDEEMAYVVLHEIAHSLTHDGRHQDRFYGTLTALVISEGVSWATAFRVEEMTPLIWEPYRLS